MTSNQKYNTASAPEIVEYAKKLVGHTLRESCSSEIGNATYGGKGHFGQILEKYYFGYEPNSISEPDFNEAHLELKSSPLKRGVRNNKHLTAKERLVLNIINYEEIVKQEFLTSSFYNKNAHLLLVFYIYNKEENFLDYLIKIVNDWEFPNEDLIVIENDWLQIKNKVHSGKAHELSEGDTFYLGACTKGSSADSVRNQPNSDTPAKQRAFSLKQGYVNHIISSLAHKQGLHLSEPNIKYGKILKSTAILESETPSIEVLVDNLFRPFYNKEINEIIELTSFKQNKGAKNFYSNLTKVILGVNIDEEIEEFSKADIEIKTVRLKENDMPCEDISFPAFRFVELIEEDWDESDIKNRLEKRFLFVFFKYQGNKLILKKVMFWNMPFTDILEVKKVWERTREVIGKGEIVNRIVKGRRYTNFPSTKFCSVAHVRPHAKDKNDTFPLPTKDKFTGLDSYTKQCFWLNKSYIKEGIYRR